MLLSNRVAIVTGGAKGIGRGIALKFAEEGCSIAIADVLAAERNKILKEISERGVKGLFFPCDATDSHQVSVMVEQVIREFGKVDILVNNVGGIGRSTPITDMTEEQWDKVIALNLKGCFLFCRAVIPHMKEQRYGKIVNISSLAALTPGPSNVHYGAAKGGVLSLTFDLAVQLASFNICVNAILPGIIRTDMWQTNIPPNTNEDEFFQQRGRNNVPMQRVGTPEDVAGVALFFASDLSRYVTGDRIIVGGGLPFRPPPSR